MLLGSGTAGAEGWLTMSRGDEHRLDLGRPGVRKVVGYVSPARSGWVALDAWYQVAPGGNAVATWSAGNGLRVFSPDGQQLYRTNVRTVCFRFSPDGMQLAVGTPRGLDVIDIATGARKTIARQAGIERLRWMDAGPVALVRRGKLADLVLVGAARKVLAKGRPIDSFDANGAHVAWHERDKLVVDGAEIALGFEAPARHLEVAADGRVLLGTTRQVWLRRPGEQPALVADEPDVHSLAFSRDGSAYLWASRTRGAVVGATTTPLPGTLGARFADDGTGVVITGAKQIFVWPDRAIAGISAEDGDNLAGHLLAGDVPLALYRIKSGSEKIHQTPVVMP
jgi:hypothetical protein